MSNSVKKLVSLCSYRSGAAALMSMNLSQRTARISLPKSLSSSTVEAFVLESEQPGEEGLRSRCCSAQPPVAELASSNSVMRKLIICQSSSLKVEGFSRRLEKWVVVFRNCCQGNRVYSAVFANGFAHPVTLSSFQVGETERPSAEDGGR